MAEPARSRPGLRGLLADEASPTGLPAGRAFVLTISDGIVAGTRRDESGLHLAARLAELGFTVERGLVADGSAAIGDAVRAAVAAGHRLVVTTGGTGLTSRDVTPQAIRPLLDYEAPGIGELMRAAGARSTPLAALSRSFGGVVGRTLVVAVPGSPRGALESLEAIVPLLAHALETLADDSSRHAAGVREATSAPAPTTTAPRPPRARR